MIDFAAWLKDPAAVRVALIEVGVKTAGLETTRYLSTKPYVTSPTDSPANQFYLPVVTTGLQFTEQLDLEGQGNFNAGDIEISNYNGERDAWLDDIWDNHPIKVWIGDPRWIRADFQLIFNGVVATIGSKSRDVLNIVLRDKLQRLNTPVTDTKIGGSDANKDDVVSLTFGEAHNVTPQLTNPVTLEYQVHDNTIERIIEVRDNGKPVGIAASLGSGRFTLNRPSAGAITASIQGDAPGGSYNNTIASLVKRIVSGYGKASDRFSGTTQLAAGNYDYVLEDLASFSRASTATYIDVTGSILTMPTQTLRTADYTTGVARTLIEDSATNYATASATLTTGWTGAASNTNGNNYRGISYRQIAKVLSSNNESRSLQVAGILANQIMCLTLAVRADTVSNALIGLFDFTNSSWGANADAVCTIIAGPGSISQFSGGGWIVSSLSTTVDTVIQIVRKYTLNCTGGVRIYPGSYTSTTIGDAILATRVQVEAVASLSSNGTSYIPTTTATVTRAGDVAMTWNDIDGKNFTLFDSLHPQPVGVYADGRTNVLELCQQLANSVDAQLVMSRTGLLRLIQLTIPGTGTPVVVTEAQMVERSLKIQSRPFVKGAVMLGFNKNYTVQEGLLTSIPEAHKTLFAMEWLTATVTEPTVIADYKLNDAPPQTDTMLCKRTDAQVEAQRRLDMWKVPRTVFQFEGTADLLATLELGSAITIFNRRFNLQNGKTGIVVSLAPNWLNGRVTVGVLV